MQRTLNPRQSQLELFCPSTQIPRWTAMPSEAKQKTIPLLSRLFRQHWENRRGLPKEASHE